MTSLPTAIAESKVDRRLFLRSALATIALPSLEAFASPAKAAAGPKNFVSIGTWLGWHQNAFFPKQAGRDYEMPTTLQPLAKQRDAWNAKSFSRYSMAPISYAQR